MVVKASCDFEHDIVSKDVSIEEMYSLKESHLKTFVVITRP